MPLKIELEVVEGLATGRTYQLAPPGGLLGRDPGCALPLPSPRVSSRHAELRFGQDQWLIRDLGSRNGTFLNNARIGGDYVSLGTSGELWVAGERLKYSTRWQREARAESPEFEVPTVVDASSPPGWEAPPAPRGGSGLRETLSSPSSLGRASRRAGGTERPSVPAQPAALEVELRQTSPMSGPELPDSAERTLQGREADVYEVAQSLKNPGNGAWPMPSPQELELLRRDLLALKRREAELLRVMEQMRHENASLKRDAGASALEGLRKEIGQLRQRESALVLSLETLRRELAQLKQESAASESARAELETARRTIFDLRRELAHRSQSVMSGLEAGESASESRDMGPADHALRSVASLFELIDRVSAGIGSGAPRGTLMPILGEISLALADVRSLLEVVRNGDVEAIDAAAIDAAAIDAAAIDVAASEPASSESASQR